MIGFAIISAMCILPVDGLITQSKIFVNSTRSKISLPLR